MRGLVGALLFAVGALLFAVGALLFAVGALLFPFALFFELLTGESPFRRSVGLRSCLASCACDRKQIRLAEAHGQVL